MDVKIPKDLFLRIRAYFLRLDEEYLDDAEKRIIEDIETKYAAIRRHDEYSRMVEARKYNNRRRNSADA